MSLRVDIHNNRMYSMRAFARDLGISPSRLSALLSGRYGLSPAAAVKVSAKAQFELAQKELFITLVEAEHSRSATKRDIAAKKLKALTKDKKIFLEMEIFEVIAEWYHIAILELSQIKPFDSGPGWIASALGVGRDKVTAAIQRLLHLGLLKQEDGNLTPAQSSYFAPPNVPSRAKRKLLLGMGQLALERLETVPYEEREFSSLIFSINRKNLAKYKAAVRAFSDEMNRLSEAETEKDSVFGLNVQLFDLLNHIKRGKS